MPVSDQDYREMEARASVAEDIICRLINHYLDGAIVLRGPAFGTWQRAENLVLGQDVGGN